MAQQPCTLCDLPTPDPPITEDDVDGVFCCPGCLEVYRLLGDLDEEQAAQVRDRISGDETPLDALPDDAAEAFLNVSGMHCSTCEAFIETIAEQSDAIYHAEASYASDMVKLHYDPERFTEADLPNLVSHAGYTAGPIGEGADDDEGETIVRLLFGGFFAMLAMMGYVLFLYPHYYGAEGLIDITDAGGTYAFGNIWVFTSIVLGLTGYPILRSAWVSLRVLQPNMDLLVALAAVSAYLYSTGAILAGQTDLYFDVTIVIIMAVSIGNFYERRIKQRATGLLSELTRSQIDSARRCVNGTTETVAVDELQPGDHVVVKAGERVPIDGTIVEGAAAIDESLLTGESLPVDKTPGDPVIGGSVVTDNALVVEVGDEAQSTLDRLVSLMWDIQAARPGAQRLADRIAAVFVPGVLVLAAGTVALRLILGAPFTSALLTGLAVLIVSCPCALGLATPLAIASGLREALQRGIVIKDTSVFEHAQEAHTLAFDKTGTLTTATMRLLTPDAPAEVLQRARAVEALSTHPVAQAITNGAPVAATPAATQFRSSARGAEAMIDGSRVLVGHPDWFRDEGWVVPDDLIADADAAEREARVPVFVGWDGAARGLLIVGDELRSDWEAVLDRLRAPDREIVVITGDSEAAADRLRASSAIDRVFAEVRPEAKSEIIRRLRSQGPVAMIGDGSNDAPALAVADLGIAFGPTALAADSADVVILDDRLEHVPTVFQLARLTRRRIRQNLGWAFLYNGIAIPLALAGALNPLFAALAMATSSVLVVSNSARAMPIEE